MNTISVMLKSKIFGRDYLDGNSSEAAEARNRYEERLWAKCKIGHAEFIRYKDSKQKCIGFYIMNGCSNNSTNKKLFLQMCKKEIANIGPEIQQSSLNYPLKSIYFTWEDSKNNFQWLNDVLRRFGSWDEAELEDFLNKIR